MSQSELADKANFRQAAISWLETGNTDVTASEIVYLSFVLNNPIIYFYSTYIFKMKIDDPYLSLLEHELLIQAKRLNSDDLRRLFAQLRALVDLADK